MKNFEMPVFSNGCGKLFSETIVFASANKESVIKIEDIKSIVFKKSVAWGGMWLLGVPLSLFGLTYFVNNNDVFVKVFLYAVAAMFTIICLLKTEKKYAIKILIYNEPVRTIRVSKDNIKDAQKFVNHAVRVIMAKRAATKSVVVTEMVKDTVFS